MTTVLHAKPIPQTLSASAKPGAVSFLSLPGEVRNQVYELLVPTNEEIEITCLASHTPASVVYSLRSTSLLFRKAECVPLLSSCRQIYHESLSLLLSSNTWVLLRGGNSEATNLVAWMGILGSTATMLRKVVINLAVKPCNQTYEIWYGDAVEMSNIVKLGGLVKALWADCDAKFRIELAVPDDMNHYKYVSLYSRWHRARVIHVVFSNVLQALREDSLHLKRYKSQIRDILVSLDSLEGYVEFSYISPDHRSLRNTCGRWFSIADNGKTLSFLPTKKLGLMALAKSLKERIFVSITFTSPDDHHPGNLKCPAYPPVCYNLDLGTVEGATPILTALNSALRSRYRTEFWHRNRHLIKMRSGFLRTDFNRFNKLRKFLCIASTSYRPWDMGERFHGSNNLAHPYVELLLEFRLQDATNLDNLRINMLDFLRVTSYCTSSSPKITFKITNEDGSTQSQASIRLDRLREFATVALTEFDLAFPWNRLKPCPNIWVNGYGRIVQVERDGKSFNPWEFIRDWWFQHDYKTIYQNDWWELCKKYTTSIRTRPGLWDEDYKPSSCTFYDGTLACYLGYLQHFCAVGNAEHWASFYFAFPEP